MNAYLAPREIALQKNLVALGHNDTTQPNWSGSDRSDEADLKALFARVWCNKWRIAACALVVAILTLIVAALLEPRYTARSRIMLDPRQLQIVTSEAVVSEISLSNPVVETEVAVMRSNTLLREVVVALGLDYLNPIDPLNAPSAPEALWHRVDALVSTAFGGALTLHGNTPSKEREATTGRKVQPTKLNTANDSAAIRIDNTDTAAEASKKAADGKLQSKEVRKIFSQKLKQVGRLALVLDRNIKVAQDGVSYVISIQAEDSDPVRAARIANTIIDQYLEQQRSRRRMTTENATMWLEEQVADLRQQVEIAEERIEKYKADRLVLDGSGSEVVERQLTEISNQLAVARAERATAKARYDSVSELIKTEGLTAAARTLSSPMVIAFQEQRGKLARQEAELTTRYGVNHPERLRVRSELQRLDSDMASEVEKIVATLRNELSVADIRVSSLTNSIRDLEGRLGTISSATLDLREFEREAESARSAYAALLNRLKETRMQAALPGAEAVVIDRAYPSGQPSSPPVKLLTVLGGVLGLVIGLGGVFVSHLRAVGYENMRSLQYDTDLPVLAVLSKLPKLASSLTGGKRAQAAQRKQFHLFLETLKLAGSEGAKNIALTSPLLSDAAPWVGEQMARTLAEGGERVLYVIATSKAELFRYRTMEARPLVSNASLADVFLGKVSPAEAAISLRIGTSPDSVDIVPESKPTSTARQKDVRTTVDNKKHIDGSNKSDETRATEKFKPFIQPVGALDVIGHDNDGSHSVNVVSPSHVRSFLDRVDPDYDIVIFDAAGVLDTTSAQTIAKACDLTVCQVRQAVTEREAVHHSLFRLQNGGVRLAGLVMTTGTKGSAAQNGSNRYHFEGAVK